LRLQRSALRPAETSEGICFVCGELGQIVAYDTVCNGSVCEGCIDGAVAVEILMIAVWSTRKVRHPNKGESNDWLRN